MKRLWLILLLINSVWGQDVYPIFDFTKDDYVNTELANKNFAVFSIEEPFMWATAGLAERIQSKLLQQNFTVVDRELLNTTIQEKNLSMSGITVGTSEVFSVLNIDYVITGSARSGIFKLLYVENGALVATSKMTDYGPRKDNIDQYVHYLVMELVLSLGDKEKLSLERTKSLLISDEDFDKAQSNAEGMEVCYTIVLGIAVMALIDAISPDDEY